MDEGENSVAQAALTAAGKAQATADNARSMVLNRDPRLQSLEAETVTLAGLAADYQAQLAASIEDRADLRADVTELIAEIQGLNARISSEGYEESEARATADASLRAALTALQARFDAFEPVPGPQGQPGASAYEVAREAGYGGTRSQWLASLKGDAGAQGPQGIPGNVGPTGPQGVAGPTGAQGTSGPVGPAGVAGPVGPVGAMGPQGIQGPKGDTGAQGAKGDPGTPADMAQVADLVSRVAALEGRAVQIEYRDGVAVPAAVVLLGSTTVDVPVAWPTPFPDTSYTIIKPQLTANNINLLGRMEAVVKSKSTTGCVVTVTTTGTLSAGNATLGVLAYRKA